MISNKPIIISLTLLLIITLTTSRQSFRQTTLNGEKLNYGSLVKLFHPETGYMLHSHGVWFGMLGSYSITGYMFDDHGSYWQLNEKLFSKTKTYNDIINCGDSVVLRSAIIEYYMQSEDTATGLTSTLQQFITGMKKETADGRVNWKIVCQNKEEGEPVVFGDFIRLRHDNTGKYASLSKSFVYNEGNCGRGCTLAGQLQPHAIQQGEDESTIFQIVAGMNSKQIQNDENQKETQQQ